MQRTLFLFIILAFSIQLKAGNPKQIIACNYNNVSFDDFVNDIFAKTNVKIYYKTEWIKNKNVTLVSDSISVESAVKLAIENMNLKVSIWQNQIVLTPLRPLLNSIPDYEASNSVASSEETNSNSKFIKTQSANTMTEITLGQKQNIQFNRQKAQVRVKIIDNETKESLAGATLFIDELKTGAASDYNGFAEIYVYPGKYHFSMEFLGFKKRNFFITVNSSGNFTAELYKSGIELSEVSVFGDRMMERSPGIEKIRTQVVKQLPAMLGEVDLLKISEMLPGIVSVGEGSSGVNVRGGSYDQNAFYINKIPLFNTSHLLGFSSAFNPDIIKDFTIYKGYIPTMYGGHLTSVFDIETRKGNLDHFTAHGGVSPLASNIVIEAPIKKEVASIILSARTSYSDWILSRIKDPIISTSHANFNDLSGEFSFNNEKNQFNIFLYHSHDYFALGELTEYQYDNSGLSMVLKHKYSEKLTAEYSIAGSLYNFSTIEKSEISAAYIQKFYINENNLQADYNYQFNDKQNLNFGFTGTFDHVNRGTVLPYGFSSLLSPVILGHEQGAEAALYISDIYKILPWLELTAGLRTSVYSALGPKTIYTYIENQPKTIKNISDSILYKQFQPIKSYFFPEVRAALQIKTDKKGTIKLAFNQMHQNLFMLNTTVAISPNSQWKLADYHLRPSTGNQISFGIFRDFPDLELETSVEFYLSKTHNYTEFKDGADFLNTPIVETSVLQGNQRAYGIEMMIKKHGKLIDGWISYTYSRSLITVDGVYDWQKINDGNEYPAIHDIPNSFHTVLNYHIKKRVTLSSTLNYQTGKPVTFPVAAYFVNNNSYIDYSARNAYRIPDYFRIDLSLSIEGNLRKNKFIHSSWLFSIYNLTGRDNAYSVFFKSYQGLLQAYQYSVISIPVFTASWVFKLGNYESN
jgi:outer membrane receptor protein involved in Fe transport